MDGTEVKGTSHLSLLGVTFDRLLHFGQHCARVRGKVKPRLAHLRAMTGRSWGLREAQLRTVANGYVRGALEYAAPAWLPATSSSHVEQLDREMRAAARVITGCPRSTPVEPLMAEAGLVPVRVRRGILAARMLSSALSLPPSDPLRQVAELDPPRRLTATTGWRWLGAQALRLSGVGDVPVEERLHVLLPPWTKSDPSGHQPGPGPDSQTRRPGRPETRSCRSTSQHPACRTRHGSGATARRRAASLGGGGGALITTRSGESREVRVAAGSLCSSTRAELTAMRAALEEVSELADDLATGPVVLCTDSQAALLTVAGGPGAQLTRLGAAIWNLLSNITERDQPVTLQWVPAHCGIPGNERADELAREAADLPQEAPADVRSLTGAVARAATRAWRRAWPDSFFKRIWGDRMPRPVSGEDRGAAVDVHQLRAGHWSRSRQYLHRIGRFPSPACAGCPNKKMPSGVLSRLQRRGGHAGARTDGLPVSGWSTPQDTRLHILHTDAAAGRRRRRGLGPRLQAPSGATG